MKVKAQGEVLNVKQAPLVIVVFWVLMGLGIIMGGIYVFVEEKEPAGGAGLAGLGAIFVLVPLLMTRIELCFDKNRGSVTRTWQALGGFRKREASALLEDIQAVVYLIEKRQNARGMMYRRFTIFLALSEDRQMHLFPPSFPCPFAKKGKRIAEFLGVPFQEKEEFDPKAASFKKRSDIGNREVIS